MPPQSAKTNVQTTPCDRGGASERQFALSCLPNRAFKVNSFLRFSSTLRTSAIADSLHRQRTHVTTSRSRSAFTRRGPCVPSRSALRPSHALHQVRKQGCPSSPALSSPKGGSRQEIADIPRFAAPPGDAHRARGSLVFPSLLSCWGKASAFPCSSSQSTAPASGAAVA